MIYGKPRAVFYGPERPAFGPTRFEHQPRKVRRRGRKGLALKSRRSRLRTRASWAWHRGDLDEAKSLRRKSGGRKRRSSSRRGSSSRRRRGTRYTLSRKGWRATSKRSRRSSGRSSSHRMSRRSSGSLRRGSSRPMSMAGVHSFLRKSPGTKAWICVGPKRTGCGGGKKGGRGSRVLGFLR